MTAGRFGGVLLLLKLPYIISKTWTKSNNNGGKPSSWRRWITWSSPWTISWLLASWAAAPESTGYRTAPCPPFPGPQHSQSQSSCWQSAAPAGSRWTGPDPVCFGSKHHGNCTGSWEEEDEGRIRVNLAVLYIPNFPRVLQPVQSWEQLSQSEKTASRSELRSWKLRHPIITLVISGWEHALFPTRTQTNNSCEQKP